MLLFYQLPIRAPKEVFSFVFPNQREPGLALKSRAEPSSFTFCSFQTFRFLDFSNFYIFVFPKLFFQFLSSTVQATTHTFQLIRQKTKQIRISHNFFSSETANKVCDKLECLKKVFLIFSTFVDSLFLKSILLVPKYNSQ